MTMVAMGLMANWATRGMPLVIPPSVPPNLLVARCQGWSGSVTGRITSCTWEPSWSAISHPGPMETALTALIDIKAWATWASIFRSQLTWEPKPIGTFSAMISQVPPIVSPASLAASIAAAILRAESGSAQRTGDSSTAAQSMFSGALACTVPMDSTWL